MRRHSYKIALVFFFAVMVFVRTAIGAVPHNPISISLDDKPDTNDGIVSGSGVVDDPFVISGWSIQVKSGTAVEVKNTSACLVIRDCKIVGDGRKGIGILLSNAPCVQVTNCQLSGLRTGIFVYQSPGVIANKNNITSCLRGIEAIESDDSAIGGNTVVDVQEHAIFLWRSQLASVSENTAKNCRNGIYLDSCHHNSIERNHVQELSHGIFIWDSFDCVVVRNIIENCELGLAIVHTSERNLIFHNSFKNNVRPATCDSIRNSWDDGYPTGGNFWQGQPTVDLLSGENQNLPGPDGISDNPIQVPFQNLDRYPLIEQPVNGQRE
jgi:parallel beta-helix repeat protein